LHAEAVASALSAISIGIRKQYAASQLNTCCLQVNLAALNVYIEVTYNEIDGENINEEETKIRSIGRKRREIGSK
jgi:hypothetical protein